MCDRIVLAFTDRMWYTKKYTVFRGKGDRTLQFIKRFRVGQRAIKTAISVGLALALAMVLGSSLPIFAAIGAISVMSRTWVDSLKESLNQIAGTFLGYLIACVFVTVLPNPTFFVWMALGVLCVISLCIGLKLNFAIPLASIVFADVCLYTGGDSIVYGFHRFYRYTGRSGRGAARQCGNPAV